MSNLKRPFAVGDRVRAYAGFKYTGVIVGDAGEMYWVKVPEIVCELKCYPQQLRRLVPKKRREIWLQFDSMGIVYNSAKEQPKHQSSSWTRFIEARPKRKDTK